MLCLWFPITSHFLWCVRTHVCRCCTLFSPCPWDATFTVPDSEGENAWGIKSLAYNSWGCHVRATLCCLCHPAELEFKTVSCFDFPKYKSFQMCNWEKMALFFVHVKYRWIFSIHFSSMGKWVAEANRFLNLELLDYFVLFSSAAGLKIV